MAKTTPTSPANATQGVKRSRVIERSPVYYGWIILLAGTFGMMMTTPGQTVGVSVFLDKIIADLHASRSIVSLLYTIGTLIGSFSLSFVGRFIDRRGPRLAVVIIAALLALACVWMGFVNGLLTLLIGFVLIRGLGQGALSLVSQHVINIWFVRRRGLAIGLSGLGMACATAFFPILIELLLEHFGWRGAYMMLGGLVALTILPIGALFFRERPEHFGLHPDGRHAPAQTSPVNEVNYTLAEARRTLTFWLFVAGACCVSAFSTGLVFHHYAIMAANGLNRTVAATMFIPFGFVLAGSNLTTGILMDRVPPRFLLSTVLTFLCAALLFAPHVTSPTLVLAYGVLLGLMQGMQGAISASVYAYYFGRRHIGIIRGFTSTITIAGTAFGPLLFALGFAAFGGFALILALAALPPLTIAIMAPFIRPAKRSASAL